MDSKDFHYWPPREEGDRSKSLERWSLAVLELIMDVYSEEELLLLFSEALRRLRLEEEG